MNFSKLNRVTHRDIGYLIAGMTIIYAISGIALNHKNNWNPNYIFDISTFKSDVKIKRVNFTNEEAIKILKNLKLDEEFKTYYFPEGDNVTIFIEGGYVKLNMNTGAGTIEKITRRPIFYQINFLHYNPGRWWKYFSDTFCICLIVVTITGMLILKGRNGITKRGAILTVIGIILPLLFLFIY
jgi:hypothetical protein